MSCKPFLFWRSEMSCSFSELWDEERFFTDYGPGPFIRSLKEWLSNTFQGGGKRDPQRLQVEADRVGIASELLQISEFDFFRLAYSQWFGRDIPVPRLEHIFAEYVFEDIVPYWVRHLSRRVLKRSDQGVLDPLEFHVIPPKGSRRLRIEGYIYSIIILIITTVYCIGAVYFTPY